MINLYIRDISSLYDGRWTAFLSLLPHERRQKAQRLRNDHDAARCVGAWILLREALKLKDMDPDSFSLKIGDFGKPFLVGGPEFSISHAGPYAAVAVAGSPVGVDIEAPRCTAKIAGHFFSKAEIESLASIPDNEQSLFLQRLWVAKEAYVKALGTGLHTPFDSFTVKPGESGVEPLQTQASGPLYISEFSRGDYRIAVAGSENNVLFEEI